MAVNRRQFLKTSAAASAAFSTFTIAGTKASGNVIGANDKIRVAVAGINGRGTAHIDAYAKMKDTEIVYLVDPDTRLFKSRSERAMMGGNEKAPQTVQDVREALDDKNVDVLSIATGNYWHSLMTIWACQAGKDVYVEKPLSHNVFEGRKAVEAAKKYNRIVQHGTQRRSESGWARQIAAVHSGKYGKLLVSKGYASKTRRSIGFKPTATPPKELDYNLWLGPVQETPYHENLVHYNWHWFWATGNGEIGNQGVHQMDVALWAIPGATLPKSAVSIGGRFGYKDQAETPNTQLAVFDFGETKLVFETCGLVGKPSKAPNQVTNEFYLEAGKIAGGKFYPNGSNKGEKLVAADYHLTPGGAFGSFVHAVRSRNDDDVNATVEMGHYSAACCHLANISYQLGEEKPYADRFSTIGDDKDAVTAWEDMERAVSDGHGVDVKSLNYQVGPKLAFDPKKERFIDNDRANAMVKPAYRKPFVISDEV